MQSPLIDPIHDRLAVPRGAIWMACCRNNILLVILTLVIILFVAISVGLVFTEIFFGVKENQGPLQLGINGVLFSIWLGIIVLICAWLCVHCTRAYELTRINYAVPVVIQQLGNDELSTA